MVSVPKISTRQVGLAPRPGFRVSPQNNADASGLNLIKQANQIAQEEKDKADRLAASQALRAAKQQAQSLMWGENGLATLNGQDYIKRSGEVSGDYQSFIDKSLEGLTASQREYALPALKAEYDAFAQDVNRKGIQKMNAFAAGSYEADVESDISTAVTRFGDVGGLARTAGGKLETSQVDATVELIGSRVAAFARDYPTMIGDVRPEQYIKKKTTESVSELHARVIDQMLSTGQEKAAADYMKVYGNDLLPEHKAQANRALNDASNLATSQDIFREIENALPIIGGNEDDLAAMNAAPGVTFRPPHQQAAERAKEARRRAEAAGLSAKQVEEVVKYVKNRSEDELEDLRFSQAEIQEDLANKIVEARGDVETVFGRYANQVYHLDNKQVAELETLGQEVRAGVNMDRIEQDFVDYLDLANRDPAAFAKIPAAEIRIRMRGDSKKAEYLLKAHGDINEGREGLLPADKIAAAAADSAGLTGDANAVARVAFINAFYRQAGSDKQKIAEMSTSEIQTITNRLKVEFEVDKKGLDVFGGYANVQAGELDPTNLDYEGTRYELSETEGNVELIDDEVNSYIAKLQARGLPVPTGPAYEQLWLNTFVGLAQSGAIKP